ncbi:MAG: peroxide stress protein YaaA [Bacteroidales bacterium]|nr:peroxide stress protein YaaA [Bacteroidales bacterium]
MLLIISPAKKLSANSVKFDDSSTVEFPDESKELVSILKKYKPADLSALMKISPKLGELNYERFIKWKYPFESEEAGTAINLFKGDVYRGMDVDTFTKEDLKFAQKHLRILSGLYGVLKPLDIILPYRLEMGTKLKTKKGKNLYDFWKDKITEKINSYLKEQGDNILINLASDEYFKSIKPKKLKAKVITLVFKEYKNGEYKIVSIYAKKARGLMSRFIIKNKITTPEDIKGFNEDNYFYDDELSSENKLIFVR